MKTIIGSHAGAKRPRFFYGRLLTAEDFQLEQQYIDGQLRRLARATLGVGVVEGLVISTSESTITVSPGLAVDALGRMVELTETCTAALPAATGAWNVFVELVHEPCDGSPALGLDEDFKQEAAALRDVSRVWLEETQPSADRADDGKSVWLGRVRAARGAIEVDGASGAAPRR